MIFYKINEPIVLDWINFIVAFITECYQLEKQWDLTVFKEDNNGWLIDKKPIWGHLQSEQVIDYISDCEFEWTDFESYREHQFPLCWV